VVQSRLRIFASNLLGTFYAQVCATRFEFVEDLLAKIARIDVQRLSRGSASSEGATEAQQKAGAASNATAGTEGASAAAPGLPVRRNDGSAVSAARERYMQRKQTASTQKR